MVNLKEIWELTKDLIVLYVEDQSEARVNIENILKKFFKEVVIAENGEEGLKKFKEQQIDMVITDIRMPKMDGLEMITEIKKIDIDMPIIITTAFSEIEYFMKSIELGIDKYIIKPIDKNVTLNALYSVAKHINDSKKAKEYEEKMLQEKINKFTASTLEGITNAYPNPSILFDGEKIKFINTAFREMFNSDALSHLFLGNITIDSLFEKKEGFLQNLNDLSGDIRKDRISLQTKDGKRKIYLVIKRVVDLSENKRNTLYTFNDITLSEYQKVKIKNYVSTLEEYVFNFKYKLQKDKIETKKVEVKLKEKKKLNDREEILLRREHNKSITNATEYIESLDSDILNDINELAEIENSIDEDIYIFEDDKSLANLQKIAIQFTFYASVITNLFEFEGLSYGVKSLVSLLENVKEEDLNEKNAKKVAIFLKTIREDLTNWRVSIFEQKSVPDIHYLDSSMLSSILQVEVIFTQKEVDSQEDELDIFF